MIIQDVLSETKLLTNKQTKEIYINKNTNRQKHFFNVTQHRVLNVPTLSVKTYVGTFNRAFITDYNGLRKYLVMLFIIIFVLGSLFKAGCTHVGTPLFQSWWKRDRRMHQS